MRIQFRKIDRRLPEYTHIRRLYYKAFPFAERAPFCFLMMKRSIPGVDFLSMHADGMWVGFCYVVNYKDISYVLFLAINDDARGCGYGSYMLKALKKKYEGNRILLAIEKMDDTADNYEERLNRKHFYEKNGFELLPYRIREINQVYDSMSYGGEVKPSEFYNLVHWFLGKRVGDITDMKRK